MLRLPIISVPSIVSPYSNHSSIIMLCFSIRWNVPRLGLTESDEYLIQYKNLDWHEPDFMCVQNLETNLKVLIV